MLQKVAIIGKPSPLQASLSSKDWLVHPVGRAAVKRSAGEGTTL